MKIHYKHFTEDTMKNYGQYPMLHHLKICKD